MNEKKVKYASGWMHPDDVTKLTDENKELLEALKAVYSIIESFLKTGTGFFDETVIIKTRESIAKAEEADK